MAVPLSPSQAPLFFLLPNSLFPSQGRDASQAPLQAVPAQQPPTSSGSLPWAGRFPLAPQCRLITAQCTGYKGLLVTSILLFFLCPEANALLLDSQVQKP